MRIKSGIDAVTYSYTEVYFMLPIHSGFHLLKGFLLTVPKCIIGTDRNKPGAFERKQLGLLAPREFWKHLRGVGISLLARGYCRNDRQLKLTVLTFTLLSLDF